MHNNQCRGSGIGWPLLSIFTNLSFRGDREKNPNGNRLHAFSTGEGLKQLQHIACLNRHLLCNRLKIFILVKKIEHSLARTIEMECGYGTQ